MYYYIFFIKYYGEKKNRDFTPKFTTIQDVYIIIGQISIINFKFFIETMYNIPIFKLSLSFMFWIFRTDERIYINSTDNILYR